MGDVLFARNGWNPYFFSVGVSGCLVTAVGTNTVTCKNSQSVTASTATPQMAWRIPQWTTGDTGRLAAQKSYGVQSTLYGAKSGGTSDAGSFSNFSNYTVNDAVLNGGGAFLDAWTGLDLAVAGVSGDARAVRDLTIQSYMIDWGIRPAMQYSTGRFQDGPGYSIDGDIPTAELIMWGLTQTVPTYPKLDIDTGPWGTAPALWYIMSTLPDLFGGGAYWAGWAGAGWQSYGSGSGSLVTMGLLINPVFNFAPQSNLACYYRNYLETVQGSGQSWWGATEFTRQAILMLHNDPRICSTNWKTIPPQYAFTKSSETAANTSLGWSPGYRNDAIISRSGMGTSIGDSPPFMMLPLSVGMYTTLHGAANSPWPSLDSLLEQTTTPLMESG